MENFGKNTLFEAHTVAPPNPQTHPSTLILICFIDEPKSQVLIDKKDIIGGVTSVTYVTEKASLNLSVLL